MFSREICEIFKIYFEEHLRTTVSAPSKSYKHIGSIVSWLYQQSWVKNLTS